MSKLIIKETDIDFAADPIGILLQLDSSMQAHVIVSIFFFEFWFLSPGAEILL